MLTYTVSVTFTDRTRTETGTYNEYVACVSVSADNDAEATLMACQIAHCLRADLDPMVLGASILDCIA